MENCGNRECGEECLGSAEVVGSKTGNDDYEHTAIGQRWGKKSGDQRGFYSFQIGN